VKAFKKIVSQDGSGLINRENFIDYFSPLLYKLECVCMAINASGNNGVEYDI